MTSDVVLRPATPDDVPACAAIQQDWQDSTPWMPRLHDLAETTGWMRTMLFPRCEVTVAESGAALRGYIALDQTSVVSLAIAEGWRGKGIGARLLDHAMQVRPQGLTLWTFVANSGAQRFYARHGFAEIRQTPGDNAEGLPDVLMGWAGRA